MSIVTAEQAAEVAGRLIAEGEKAVVLCPLADGRWHIGTMQPDGLRIAARVMYDHATDHQLFAEGRMLRIAKTLHPDGKQ